MGSLKRFEVVGGRVCGRREVRVENRYGVLTDLAGDVDSDALVDSEARGGSGQR